MSPEPRPVTNTETWTQWQGQVVNGVFPLRRLLACSRQGAVFLTEYKAKNLADAAIKLIRADGVQAPAVLAQWQAAATLSHPNLVHLFEVGRCQSGGQEFLFVVMEHAEQTLAQILRLRALSPDEARELLLPTLDALAFLHRNRLVHGELKPSNFLAVGDRLKLASDAVRAAGHSATGIVSTSAYDPPELKDRGITAAGDVWSLGMTLVEALTQRTTTAGSDLPASFPAPFADTVRRCLSANPAKRPTVIELAAEYKPAAQVQPVSDPQPPARAASRPDPQPPTRTASQEVTPPQSLPKRSQSLPLIAAVLLIPLALWVGLRSINTSQERLQLSAVPTLTPAAPSAIAKPAASAPSFSTPISRPPDQSSLPPAATSPSVLHEVTPDVPQAIREKIQGRIFVTVRVLVDPSGNVIGALMEDAGPSKYFARLADNAAREWQFVPSDKQGPRVWLLRFEFTRGGVGVRAIAQ